jgi:hypothetical protein
VGGGRWKGGRDGVSAKGGEQIKKLKITRKRTEKEKNAGRKN